MGPLELLERHVGHVAKALIVFAPAGDVPIEKRLDRGTSPGGGVHSIGDRLDLDAGEHAARHFPVTSSDAVHVAAVVQREIGHVDLLTRMESVQVLEEVGRQDLPHEILGESIVARGHRGMGGEDAVVLDPGDVLDRRLFAPGATRNLAHELEGEKRRMPLVHVVGLDAFVAQRPEHTEPTDAEDDLLTEAVALVATVEQVRQAPLLLAVLRQVGVEEMHGNDRPQDALDLRAPGSQHDELAPELHLDPRLHLPQVGLDAPCVGLLRLLTRLVELLAEVPPAMDEGHRDERKAPVRRGFQGISRQHPQPSRVARDVVREAYLHREIGDGRVEHSSSSSAGSRQMGRDSETLKAGANEPVRPPRFDHHGEGRG